VYDGIGDMWVRRFRCGLGQKGKRYVVSGMNALITAKCKMPVVYEFLYKHP
jgi:hypothetical protein